MRRSVASYVSVIAAISAVQFSGASVAVAAPATAACPRTDALGVSRTVEIDTTGGPGFGMEHYKANDFLQPKEVVLTFDDGPQKYSTEMVLAALAEQCTKGTFFSIGKLALGYPEIIREVVKAGHTVGSHTWSHQAIAKLKTFEEGRDEIERGISAVHRAVGGPIAPFFRYPTLVDTPESLAYLGKRNIAMFSTDIDSFDFKLQPPAVLVKGVMTKLDKKGKGIILMHDIHKNTAKALPLLLTELKKGGYKVVHLTAKGELATIAEFDAAIDKNAKGLPQAGQERATSSIVRTIGGEAPPEEAAAASATAAAPEKSPPAAEKPAAQAALPTTAAPAATEAAASAAASGKLDVTAAPVEKPAAPTPAAASQTFQGVPAAGQAPATTASITPAPAAANAEPSAAAEPAAPPAKSFSQKAMDIWRMWFGN